MSDDTDLKTLKLDLDRKMTPCQWGRWCDRVAGVLKTVGLKPRSVEVRESGRGFHVVILLWDALGGPMELVAVQALLGSDVFREAFNFNRARKRDLLDWNLLFEAKEVHDLVTGEKKRTRVKPRMDYAIPLQKRLVERFEDKRIVVSYTQAMKDAAEATAPAGGSA